MNRRAKRTKQDIQEAFIALVEDRGYRATTVAAVCRAADVNRTSFYRYYRRLEDVLEEIVSHLLSGTVSMTEGACGLVEGSPDKRPLCERIRNDDRYRALFLDEMLSDYLITRIAKLMLASYQEDLLSGYGILPDDAETMFWFQMHGCISVTTHNLHLSDEEWNEKRCAIDRLIVGGLGSHADGATGLQPRREVR